MVTRPWSFLTGQTSRQVRSWAKSYLTFASRWRWLGPLTLTVLITILHFAIDPMYMFWHDLLRRAFYLPIVWAVYLSGLRGGAIASSVVGVIFTVHLLSGWGHHLGTQMDQVYDIVGYLVVGFGVGFLVDRSRVVAVALAQRDWDISLRGVVSAAIHDLKKPKADIHTLAGQLLEHSEYGMYEFSVGMRLATATEQIDEVRRDLAGIARIFTTRSIVTKPFDWAVKFSQTPRLGSRLGLIVARVDADSPPPRIWPVAPAVLDEVARCLLEDLDTEASIGGLADLVVGGDDYCLTIECSCPADTLRESNVEEEARKSAGSGRRVRQKLLELIWSRYNGVLQRFNDGARRGIRLTLLRPRFELQSRLATPARRSSDRPRLEPNSVSVWRQPSVPTP